MKLDSRLLTLLSVLVIVMVLGLGTVLAALPMYERVQAAQEEIVQTEGTNTVLEARIAELSRAKEQRAEIEAGIETLREQLPATPETEAVLLVVTDALAAHGAFPQSVRFEDTTPYTARTGDAAEETPTAEAPAPETSADGSTPPGDETDIPAAAQAEPSDDPQQQIGITLEVRVPDEATATAFLDNLRTESRLLLITGATFKRDRHEDSGMTYKLTVTMLSFYRTDAAS